MTRIHPAGDRRSRASMPPDARSPGWSLRSRSCRFWVWRRPVSARRCGVPCDPLDAPFTAEHGALIGGAIRAQRIEAYLKDKDHKAVAVNATGFWVTANRSGWPEAARLAAERCSDLQQ